MTQSVLTLSCPNRPGIVAGVTGCIAEHGGDIREAQQFDDVQTNSFFARITFDHPPEHAALRQALAETGEKFDLRWTLTDRAKRRRQPQLSREFR